MSFTGPAQVAAHDLSREGKFTRERERVPGEEEGLIQAVKHVDNEIVIGNGVNVRAWELSIDEYSLQGNLDRFD